jgi:glycosyltransferase involved in cell wall biosynthesis
VRYVAATGSGAGKAGRLARVNLVGVTRLVVRRRRARSLYVRYDWGVLPVIAVGRALGYRVILEVNALTTADVTSGAVGGLRGGIGERIKNAAVGVAWRSAYRLLPVTDRLHDRLVDDFGVPPERVEIVANGADTELFSPRDRAAAAQSLGLDPDDEIEAFAQVVTQRPRALLVFVGDGDEREAMERLVRERGIDERVVWAGFVADRALVATYVAASRVCLSPGSAKLAIGRPMKLAEYLAAGRAVVGSDIAGIAEMLAETGGGIAVAPHDPAAMAGALCELLADPAAADALAAASRPVILERYSWRSIASRVAAAFQ